MAIKKKTNKLNLSLVLLFILGILFYSFIVSLFVGLPIRLANDYGVYLLIGIRAYLALVGNVVGIYVIAGVFKQLKPRLIFNSVREGIVKSISYLLFFVIALLPGDLRVSAFAFLISIPLAILIAVSFSYIFGNDEMKKKIKDFPKAFKKKRPRKVKTGGSHVRATDKRRETDSAPPGETGA